MVTVPLRSAAAIAVCALLVGCHRAPHVDNSQHAAAIRRLVAATPAFVDRDKLGSTLWKSERQFYESRNSMPAWFDGDQASPRMRALVDALKHSEDHGLDPARYGLSGF